MTTEGRPGYYALRRQSADLEKQKTECAERIERLEQRVDTLNRQLSQAHEEYDQAAITGQKTESSIWAERIKRREEALRSARAALEMAKRDRDAIEERRLDLQKQLLVASWKRMSLQEREEVRELLSGL